VTSIPSQNREDEIGQMAQSIQVFKNTAVRAEELTCEVEMRKELQMELELARDQAEASNNAKSQFLATMSHEIRTPMNAIVGLSELLLMEKEMTFKQRDYIQTVLRATQNLLAVINDILDYSRIETGNLTLEPIEYNLKDNIEDVISLLKFRALE